MRENDDIAKRNDGEAGLDIDRFSIMLYFHAFFGLLWLTWPSSATPSKLLNIGPGPKFANNFMAIHPDCDPRDGL